jgi:hypothetical protein
MPARGAAAVGAASAVARPLFKGLQQQVARFAADGLPLTGVVGLPALHLLLDPGIALRGAFRPGDGIASSGGGNLDGGPFRKAKVDLVIGWLKLHRKTKVPGSSIAQQQQCPSQPLHRS